MQRLPMEEFHLSLKNQYILISIILQIKATILLLLELYQKITSKSY